MIFVALLTAFFVVRLAFRMTGSLLMIGLILLVLSDEARLHPIEARQVWQTFSEIAQRVSQLAREKASEPLPHSSFGPTPDPSSVVGYY
jgi:hypothetical protein